MSLHQRLHRLLLDTDSASTTASGNMNKPSESFAITGDSNFDSNMVFILAALLCTLILVLGLNSIIKCALRCSRRYAFETQDQRIVRLASKGLKKSALRKIPIVVYGSGSISSSFVATDCPICLGEFMDGEKVRVLPKCNHGFHVKCIDKWLLSHSSCPTCRQSLLEYPASSEASSVAVIVAAAVGTNQRL
ncbi:RING-H2 finger protein ATL74-like [Trifolium pratense]|uniref:RING-H2 finger protein ATL74-like n=1 Tax=Trifolium pratense TaxID=57577 RepID=UPI001E6953C7|nr:RING-H2 finger protein ATL74-like [Trifolium pratense]